PKKSQTLLVSSWVRVGAVVIGPTLHGAPPVKKAAADVQGVVANVLITFVGTRPAEKIPQLSGLVSPPFVVRRHIAPLHTTPGLGSGPVQGPKVLGLTSGVRTLQMTLPA